MTEARVECLCPEYRIPDLGLTLYRGQVEWVDAERARRSKHLADAQRAGAVQVRWAARCEVSKPAPPPSASPVPPWLARRRRVLPETPPPVAPQEVARRATEAEASRTRDALRDVVREEVQKALGNLRPPEATTVKVSIDPDQVRDAVLSALAAAPQRELVVGAPVPSRVPAPPPLASAAEPVFIPTGIVPAEAKAAIAVEAETSGSAAVDDAAAALKAARGTARRKQKE